VHRLSSAKNTAMRSALSQLGREAGSGKGVDKQKPIRLGTLRGGTMCARPGGHRGICSARRQLQQLGHFAGSRALTGTEAFEMLRRRGNRPCRALQA